MKLIGKLKKDVEKVESKEKAREIIAEAGMELTEEELNQVAGGNIHIFYHGNGNSPED